jgi:hypothetical protein
MSAASASQEFLHSISRGRAACIEFLMGVQVVCMWAGRQQMSPPELQQSDSSMCSFLRLYKEYYWEQMKLSGFFFLSSIYPYFPYS